MKKAQFSSLVYVSKQMKHFLNNFFFFFGHCVQLFDVGIPVPRLGVEPGLQWYKC